MNDLGFDLRNNLPIGFNILDVEEIAVASMQSPFGEVHCVMITVSGEKYVCAESIGFDEFKCHVLAAHLTEQVEDARDSAN